MSIRIRSPKNFWLGVIYLGIGSGIVLQARDYAFGSTVRMGAGFLPTILGALFVLLGLLSIVRSITEPGGAIGAIAWKPLALVVGGTILFGVLLRPVGLLVALPALVIVSASASQHFRFDWKATVALVALIVFCSLLFIKGLGVSMPLIGPLIGGH